MDQPQPLVTPASQNGQQQQQQPVRREGELSAATDEIHQNDDRPWNIDGRGGRVERHQHKKKKTSKINGSAISDIVYGAPPPKRDFFLSRVYRDTVDDDMRRYISSKGVNGVDLTLVSNVNSTFKSYKLSVLIVDKDKIMQASLWPSGVCVEKWRSRSNANNPNNGGRSSNT